MVGYAWGMAGDTRSRRCDQLPVLVLFPDILEQEYHTTQKLFDAWNHLHWPTALQAMTVYDNMPNGPAALLVLGRTGETIPADIAEFKDYWGQWGCPQFTFVVDSPAHMWETGGLFVSLMADHMTASLSAA